MNPRAVLGGLYAAVVLVEELQHALATFQVGQFDASSSRSQSRGIETYRISPMHAGGPLVIISMRLENSTVSPMS